MATALAEIVHGSCVCMMHTQTAILFRGKSGAGKSDLTLRMIHLGAELVADDQVVITKKAKAAIASPPPKLQGLLEVRGVGIVKLPFLKSAPLALVVDLVERNKIERLPEHRSVKLAGIEIPCVALHAFDASAPEKVMSAFQVLA